MGWKQGAFGTEQPTREQWISTSAAVAVLILVFVGMFVDFAPAPALRGIHMAVIFLIVGVIETALLFAHASRKGRMGQFVDRGLIRFLFLLLAIPLMLGFVSLLIAINTLPWTFTVVDQPVVNAFAVPGGFIYITRGILTYLDNEAQLVGVLGHEIGHVTARHSAQQYSRAVLGQVGLVGLGIFVPAARPFGDVSAQALGLYRRFLDAGGELL